MSTESQLREEICRIGASLYQRGYTVGSAGNISARLDDGWLITPTDACLGMMDPAAVAKVATDGTWVSGDKPSKEAFLHLSVYRERPAAQGIVHLHSTNCVAVSCLRHGDVGDVLPPITAYYVMRIGRLPLLPYFRPGDMALAEAVGWG